MTELQFMVWINENLHASEAVNTIVKLITQLGDTGMVWLILGASLMFFKQTRTPGFIMLASLAFCFVLNDFVLKEIFARPRPFSEDAGLLNWLSGTGYEVPTDYSFPSGHSIGGFACTTVLIYFYKWRAAPCMAVATLIALSRVFMCVHFPTDILCGALFGIIIGIFVTMAYKAYWEKWTRFAYKTLGKIKNKKLNKTRK